MHGTDVLLAHKQGEELDKSDCPQIGWAWEAIMQAVIFLLAEPLPGAIRVTFAP
jgi:hypothetical protein